MILLIIPFFALTLFMSQNHNRVESQISDARRNWSYIMAVVAVSQLLMSVHNLEHLFLGLFVGMWAWYTYMARKSKSTSLKGVFKTILLVLSSYIYLASVRISFDWLPLAIQAGILVVMMILQGYFGWYKVSATSNEGNTTNSNKN